MKREIIFKAKRLDNGEWVEGSYVKPTRMVNGEYIMEKLSAAEVTDTGMILGRFIEVDPETVCQYTGLKDKNGKRIFEGDKVEYDNGRSGEVVFKHGQFYAYDGYASDSTEAELKLYDDSPPFDEGFEIEVIGNIHD